MKKNTKYISLLALLAIFIPSRAYGMGVFKMYNWKKTMEDKWNKGQHLALTIELKKLRNKPNPTDLDKQKIDFLALLTEEE